MALNYIFVKLVWEKKNSSLKTFSMFDHKLLINDEDYCRLKKKLHTKWNEKKKRTKDKVVLIFLAARVTKLVSYCWSKPWHLHKIGT